MTRRALITTAVAVTAAALGAAPADAATRCVGAGKGCHKTIRPRSTRRTTGTRSSSGQATYPGGITIEKSVRLLGAGARVTTIRGGGPVVTVGSLGDATPPVVGIAGVKITGGRTARGVEGEDFRALGGGVLVPPGGRLRGRRERDDPRQRDQRQPRGAAGHIRLALGRDVPGRPVPLRRGRRRRNRELRHAQARRHRRERQRGRRAGRQRREGRRDLQRDRRLDRRRLAAGPQPRGRARAERALRRGRRAARRERRGRRDDPRHADRRQPRRADERPARLRRRRADRHPGARGRRADRQPRPDRDRALGVHRQRGHRARPAGQAIVYDAALHVLDTAPTMRDVLISGNRVEADTLTTEDTGRRAARSSSTAAGR